MSQKLKGLRGRSLDELRVRGMQTLAVLAERSMLLRPAQIRGSGDDLLEQFRTRSTPQLSPAFDDRLGTVAELRRHFANTTNASLIERADRIVQERFDLLGLRDVSFGSPIDWHLDPSTGTRTSLAHWSRFARPGHPPGVDRKLTWELNRHQSFVVLGRAYWLTDDARYAESFSGQLTSWLDANPPERGINWSSSLEVALRAISWTWALHFFRDAPQLTPDLFRRTLEQLHAHGRHIATHLSTYFSPNTHLTGEALALFYLGTVWPDLPRVGDWRQTGLDVLLSSLATQVGADGVYFERSTAYHRYTVEFYSHLLALESANGSAVNAAVGERLAAMLEHLLYVSRPDGTLPLLGDDDGGRLLLLDERSYTDVRPTLFTGAALLGRDDYLRVAGTPSEEALWLLGPGVLRTDEPAAVHAPVRESRGFDQGGLYVMRDSWSEASNALTISCGTSGGAHAHADALAVDLSAAGRQIVVDAGTYTYLRGGEYPDDFRTTAAHNTVTVDGLSASVPSGPFGWSHIAQCTRHAWHTHPRFNYFAGAHDGYHRLPDPVTHIRSILFVKGCYWVIRDQLVAAGTHTYDLRFHFVPSAQPDLLDSQGTSIIRERPPEAPGLEIATFGPPGAWAFSSGYVSPCYGARDAAAVASFSVSGNGPQELITFVFPRTPQQAAVAVREVAATGGRAFEILDGGHVDGLLTGSGAIVRAGAIESDFELTWTRADEMVLVNGTRISVSGEEVVRTPTRTGGAHAHASGGIWAVELACAE